MTVASAGDDFAPELSGIFRSRGIATPVTGEPSAATEAAVATADGAAIPLPRRRPAGMGATAPKSLAYLAPSR